MVKYNKTYKTNVLFFYMYLLYRTLYIAIEVRKKTASDHLNCFFCQTFVKFLISPKIEIQTLSFKKK